MGKREAETENHWPGFVDVLSTIVMVVTFLLIILGIVIFVISKNISQELENSAQKVEAAQAALAEAQDKAVEAQRKMESQATAESQAQSQAQNQAEKSQQGGAKSEKSASVYRSQLSEELTQNDEVESKDKLSVRTRQTKNTKQIVISTTEQEIKLQNIRVKSSIALLSLFFKGGIKITDEVSSEVQSYLASNYGSDKKAKYEIRAFFNTTSGSISEAKRLAYYRALATRNQLLTHGIKSGNIAIRLGNSERLEDAGKVNIYLK